MAESSRRLFLACWPDDTLRGRLHQLSRKLHKQVGGRRTARENLHMTLLFLGNTPAHREQALRRMCQALEADSFCLNLDRIGIWPRPRIAWAAPASIPAPLAALSDKLKQLAEYVGQQTDKRVLRPHVTLLRKVSGRLGQHEITPMHWAVDRFVLVESKTRSEGVQYRVIEEYDLINRPLDKEEVSPLNPVMK